MRPAKKLMASLAAVGVIAALSGCGAAGGGDDSAPVALRMSVWTSDEKQLALFDSMADEYIADHPEIESVTFESLPFADYNSTLTTQAAGGNAPDLAWVGDIAKDLIDAGALAPLTETFEGAEGYEYDDILPSVAQSFSQDGELYAYPFSNSPFALYVNQDLIAQAGQTVDPATLSWEDVDRIGAAVNESTGKAGYIIRDFDFSGWLSLANLWAGWGAQPWSDDGTQCTMDSPEMVEAFQFFHDSVYVSGATPGPGVTADFFAGDAAFTTAQVSRASLLDGSFPFEIYPLPVGPAGEYGNIGQAGMAALAGGDHVEEATGFLSFMTNPENSAKLAQFFPPPRESLLSGEELAKVNTRLSAEQLDRVVVDELADVSATPPVTSPAEITSVGKTALDRMWSADADVAEVLGGVCDAIAPVLQGK
ncbi:sugar ABC transporter substrate-binding protein [Rathayibacter sp. AY1F3]|uniref:ABC transporter substrate-binding protein n=1 Tax=Rathayibacter sp. AY1F3 TaxID=2080558 RepID=UPI000CE79BB5|nr:sugar ABC transporter substrate-binding protein [Rathayibacter sp. AY1F3]PPG87237.1 sugar ABC transporter substrate-binding protein [Rathayibacter sp. AY1F3]